MSKSKFLLSLLVVGIFIAGLGLGYFLFQSLNNNDVVNQQRNGNKRYLSDELLLVGKDKEDRLFILNLELNRKQTSLGTFQHYYTYDTIIAGQVQQSNFNKISNTTAILSGGLVSNFVYAPAEDLSTREGYTFTVRNGNKEYSIKTSQFEGDFLVKNSPDYTKYASVGKAMVTIDDTTFVVNALLTKSYAENYSTYVFFDGYDELDSTTHLLALWDSADNFYFVDQSTAKSTQKNYKSHTWVLFKSPLRGMKKSYTANITHPTSTKNPSLWAVSLPDLNDTHMDLDVSYYDKQRASGIVKGTIKDKAGSRSLYGYAIYAEY